MIIDIHTHVFGDRGWLPEWFWERYRGVLARNAGLSIERVEAEVLPSMWDPDGDKLVAEMDLAGVDVAAVLCLDYGLVFGGEEAAYPVEVLNLKHASLVQRHPGRILFAVGVDPRRPNAVDVVRRGVTDQGAKLVKLYPPAGFYPNEEHVNPIYQECIQLGVPVIFHTGPALAPFHSKYAHPDHLDDVAANFPELKIIAGHAGHGWWRSLVAVARPKFNIYLDLSGWWLLSPTPHRIFEGLREIMDLIPGRAMFGTDYIGVKGTMPSFAKLFKDTMASGEADGVKFTQDEMEAFLGGTAADLLGL